MQLSLATRIFLGYAVVLLTFGAVALFTVTELRRNQVETRMDQEGYFALGNTLSDIDTFQKNLSGDLTRLRAEANLETRRALVQLARLSFPNFPNQKMETARTTLDAASLFAPRSERPHLHHIEELFTQMRGDYTQYVRSAEDAFAELERTKPQPDLDQKMQAFSDADATLAGVIRRLKAAVGDRINNRVNESQARERATGIAIIALSVLAIAVGLLALGLAARSLAPVATLIKGVERIRQGDYSTSLGVQGADEIAVLAREFDALTKALAERQAQLKANQEELLRSERLAAMGRVSAQVAHEIRNPLSSIGLNVEMLSDAVASATFRDAATGPEAKDLVRNITREVDRLTEITEEYLRLARLPAPNKRRESVSALIDSVLDFGHEELTRAKVTVEKTMPEPELKVDIDEGQLRQVMLNLLRNSREAMPEGGTLKVAVAHDQRWVRISIEDGGSGIPASARDRLFEPFFTTKEGGTGLGLPLSRQIVEAHGGTLDLGATSPAGTTFVIALPLP